MELIVGYLVVGLVPTIVWVFLLNGIVGEVNLGLKVIDVELV